MIKNTQLNHGHHQTKTAKYSLCILADNINVPMNIGSLFRIADALGVEHIFLSGTSLVPPNKKITKTSRSTEKYVAFSYDPDPVEVVMKLREQGYTIISLELSSCSIDVKDLNVTKDEKICLIVGSENRGVSQALLDISDKTVHITMMGRNSSMNVATAAAIAVYEITRKYNILAKT